MDKITYNNNSRETGALPVFPHLVGGKYKIFVSKSGKLFLDDFNGRRKEINKSSAFLPQVSNFLKTLSSQIDIDKISYGGYRYDKLLTYNTCLYLCEKEDKYPENFNITVTNNEHLDKSYNLNYTTLIQQYNLESIGLIKIFNEINDTFKKSQIMFYNNFEENYLLVFGYDINETCWTQKFFDTKYLQANQSDFNYVNNKIMEFYQENNIIYPRFIDVEFEIDTDKLNKSNYYTTFYGFYSKDNKSPITTIDYITLIQKNNSWEQIVNRSFDIQNYVPKKYDKKLFDVVINNPRFENPSIYYQIKFLNTGDFIRLLHPNNSVIYDYVVTENDIQRNIYSTIKSLFNKLQLESNGLLKFYINEKYSNINFVTFHIEYANIDLLVEKYIMQLSSNFISIDNTNKFRLLGVSDYVFQNNIDDDKFSNLSVVTQNDVVYTIVDKFYLNNKQVIRLSSELKYKNNVDLIITIYEEKYEKIVQLLPIPFLKYNNSLKVMKQFNNVEFIENLRNLYGNTNNKEFIDALNDYQINMINDKLPYLDEENVNFESDVFTDNYNTQKVQSIIFKTLGNSCFNSPLVYNIDNRFYEKSAIVNSKMLYSDDYKYHWFLIKTNNPLLYKENKNNYHLRYFNDKPKITTKLKLTHDNLGICETIFLGVKYQIPAKYKNYDFAVYLEPNNNTSLKVDYRFDVDNKNKTLYLVINKFIDFNDLIRGGDSTNNQPLVDLSLFYNTKKNYNKTSNNVYSFDTGGLLICDNEKYVQFNGAVPSSTRGWRTQYNGEWYVCVKRSTLVYSDKLTNYIPAEGDYEFYTYSTYTNQENQEISYLSIKYILKDIIVTTDDYVWCKDIIVKFYDSPITDVDLDNNRKTTIQITDYEDNQKSRIQKSVVINGETHIIEILNKYKEYSLKRDYWELSQKIRYTGSNIDKQRSVFTFPENTKDNISFQNLLNKYYIGNNIYSSVINDYKTNNPSEFNISMFERNQLWNVIRDLASTNIHLKSDIENNTIFDELLVYNLDIYAENKSIKTNTGEFIKINVMEPDYGVVIWNGIFTKIQRYSIGYEPLLTPCDAIDFQFEKYWITRNDFINPKHIRKLSYNTIYDKNFISENVNNTGIYKELMGNITSSLFTNYSDFTLKVLVDENTEEIDFYQVLKASIQNYHIIFNDKNTDYISKINNNIDEYIYEVFLKKLMTEYFDINTVTDDIDKRLEFIKLSNFKIKITKTYNYKKIIKINIVRR